MEETTSDCIEERGIIILGNSGVGKSFLANVLIGHEVFAHKFSASSVTHKTERVQARIGSSLYTIFNIPGLIEAEQERINSNKAEIDKAFEEMPNSIVVFVFGHQNGRIRDEDVVAFNAINAAYSCRPESLAIIVNGLPVDRNNTYDGTTLVLLQYLIKDRPVLDSNVCFLDQIDVNDVTQIEIFKEELLKIVAKCKPMVHKKIQEIETRLDQLKHAQKEVRENQANFEVERKRFVEELGKSQSNIRDAVCDQQNEKAFLQRSIRQQEENLDEERFRMKRDEQLHQLQVYKLQIELDQARRAYEEIRKNPRASPKEVHHSRSVIDELRQVFTKLIVKGLSKMIGTSFPLT